MIYEIYVRKYCCEDISLIENYKDAINNKEQTWHCHHKLEIELNKSKQELIYLNLYYNRPANELIFLTNSEHKALHNTTLHLNGSKNPMYNVHRYGKENPMYGKHHSDEAKQKMKKPHKYTPKRKDKWLTPTGEIIEMFKGIVSRYHPDWKLIDESF